MLKKENRLKSKKAFTATYRNNLVVSNDLIVAYFGQLKNDINSPTRVGFVVSKKVHKRAVVRNRIKRLLRENVRLMFKDNNNQINKFRSVIFLARINSIDKDLLQIKNSIVNLFTKIANKNI